MSQRTNWYQLPVSEVIQALAKGKAGLTSSEAKLRLAKYGSIPRWMVAIHSCACASGAPFS
ncbi:cation-transporting P-type ATPase [Chloroflexota bacterium]